MLTFEVLTYAAAFGVAALIAGLLAGIFGIGGGAVLVPVLYQFLLLMEVDASVAMHVSIGTSLGIIIPTSLRSFTSHKKRGTVDLVHLKNWLVPIPVGVVLASVVAAYISGGGLRAIFAVIAFVVALRLLFNRDSWRLGEDLPSGIGNTICGVVFGFVSTLMGIGGGVLNNTYMTLFGRPMHQAVATSAGVGVLISIPGVIGYIWAGWGNEFLPPYSLGYVNVLAVLLVMPITVLVAPLGVKISHAMSKRALEFSFGLFLLVVSARFAATLI